MAAKIRVRPAHAPKEMFWVDFNKNGDPGGHTPFGRHYAAPKGGKFSTLDAAKDRKKDLLREWPTAIVTIYTTGPIEWKEVPDAAASYLLIH